MCRDGRGLGSKLVSFAKGFSKHTHILAIFKVDSEYLRFPFKVKVDYFILYSILVIVLLISSKKSSGLLKSVSALKVHFDIYLYFSLNDRLSVVSLVTSP